MSNTKRMILMVACSSLASQIYLNMFVDGFIIAMSVVVMGIFLYAFKDLNPMIACMLVGIFSPLFRFVVLLFKGTALDQSAMWVVPDMVFFFSYAVFFGLVFRKLGYSYPKFYVRLVLCDFLSNCMEMSTRFLLFYTFDASKFGGLIILAVCRSLFILLICFGIDGYKSLLEKFEHEENYKKLVLMASTFNSEVYFMKKNMNEIEDIMTEAFSLYKSLGEEGYPQEYQQKALLIAKDIHEVKKGYSRVIQGIQENFLTEFDAQLLSLKDIFKILTVDVEANVEALKSNISLSYSYDTNYMVEKHFAFMSILRNLIANSIDALVNQDQYRGVINISCKDKDIEKRKYCVISVSDNGPGISEEYLDVLFSPGFSTKYSEETGDKNRGLGLTLVKDLLETQFNGTIDVASSPKGTTFTLTIPVSAFVLQQGTEPEQ